MKFRVPFNRPPYTGNEDKYVLNAMRSEKISGDGPFGLRCQVWFEKSLGCTRSLLTPSCTQALEMAALLLDIQQGDEIIMPSFTFVSTANAFVLRGAKIIFVDIRPDTMNINEDLIEAAITQKTKAIVPVHYAGVACEMNKIMEIANRYDLFVIEDAAQGIMATYDNLALGSIGHLGAYSFHETKNITSGGEGGLLIINDDRFAQRAEIIREKGTNRSQFFRGMVDKYSWVDLGSSYLPSDIQAAYLWGQLINAKEITQNRMDSWELYWKGLIPLVDAGLIEVPSIPDNCVHNGHMFFIKVKNIETRAGLLAHLKRAGVYAVFHYIPLHSSVAGKRFGHFHGTDRYTTLESERLIRLPLFYGMKPEQIDIVVKSIAGYISRFLGLATFCEEHLN
jgi:dTDP-4-amino-4,6-dideoxygalactose transaminase